MYVPLIDLQEMYSRAKTDLDELSNKNVLLTGQTGFFGIWLLSLLSYFTTLGNRSPNLYIVSRDPRSFELKFPNIVKNLRIRWIKSDIRNFQLPVDNLDYVLHGASTSASETYNGISDLEKHQTIVDGTEHVLSLIKKRGVKSFLYLSSGAVYGGNSDANLIEEGSVANIIDLNPMHTLGKAKIEAESLCNFYKLEVPKTSVKIARCFSFVGPQLPLNLHYAIGNFIQSSLQNRRIFLQSDGVAVRSYLYIGDATVWIVKALTSRSSPHFALHIGSELPISIRALADLIARATNSEVIEAPDVVLNKSPAPNFYVPSTRLSRSLLQVSEWTTLRRGIERTMLFNLNNS